MLNLSRPIRSSPDRFLGPHALTIGVGACLLFLIQPMLGRVLLPRLGGSASVWTACLATFQCLLLAGYLYADLLVRHVPPTAQRIVHLTLLVVALLFLPGASNSAFSNLSISTSPTLAVVSWILSSAALPLLLLSATSPLVASWYRDTPGARSAYRLYALSNAGSLLAVFLYPVLIEPYFTLRQQFIVWKGAYLLYLFATALAAFRPRIAAEVTPLAADDDRANLPRQILWFALAMCGSAMLASTTNLISQEIAVVPFLWMLPLGIYLLTLIAAFDHPRWYRRGLWMGMLSLLTLPACVVLYAGAKLPFEVQLGVSLLALLAACAVCHGELSCARPSERHLTGYYLVMAAGGCAGGLFVAAAAPHLFPGYWEYHLSLWGSCFLGVVAGRATVTGNGASNQALRLISATGLVALAVILAGEAWAGKLHARVTRRSFYGVVRLVEGQDEIGPFRKLAHGRIAHGLQYLDDDKQAWGALYFGRRSAVGITFDQFRQERSPLHVGVIGLGTGTIASYGNSGDTFRFYELDPDVDWFARSHFTYLSRSPANVEVVLGDARLSLERELTLADPQPFDLLFVDAFCNDAIPIHLLTKECGDSYFRRLKADGALLLHISNRWLDLEPVVRALARAHGREAIRVHAGYEPERGAVDATWMVITSNPSLGEQLRAADKGPKRKPTADNLWTDDFSSLWQVLRGSGGE